MNFIEKTFKEKLTGDEFLQAREDYLDEPDLESILKQYPKTKNFYTPFSEPKMATSVQ